MHRILTLAATLCLAGAVAAAQHAPAQNQTELSARSEHRGSIGQALDEQQGGTVRGCLQNVNGTFWLNTVSGDNYRLSGHTGDLARYVGHEVKVTGAAARSSNRHNREFDVSSARQVASACPTAMSTPGTQIQGTPWKGHQGGVAGTSRKWNKGKAKTPPPRDPQGPPIATNPGRDRHQNVAPGKAVEEQNDAYQKRPQKKNLNRNLPKPPLPNARPEDQTPSAGPPAGGQNSNSVAQPSGERANRSGVARGRHSTLPNVTNEKRQSHSQRSHHKKSPTATGTANNPSSTGTPPPRQ